MPRSKNIPRKSAPVRLDQLTDGEARQMLLQELGSKGTPIAAQSYVRGTPRGRSTLSALRGDMQRNVDRLNRMPRAAGAASAAEAVEGVSPLEAEPFDFLAGDAKKVRAKKARAKKVIPSGLAKWGGMAVKGLGVAAALFALKQLYDGFQQGEFGGENDLIDGVDLAVKGGDRAVADNALHYERGLAKMLNRGNRGARETGRNQMVRQTKDELELRTLLVDRGAELDAIAEKYKPNLAERMARMGVL